MTTREKIIDAVACIVTIGVFVFSLDLVLPQ